jgi:hypothetical protein
MTSNHDDDDIDVNRRMPSRLNFIKFGATILGVVLLVSVVIYTVMGGARQRLKFQVSYSRPFAMIGPFWQGRNPGIPPPPFSGKLWLEYNPTYLMLTLNQLVMGRRSCCLQLINWCNGYRLAIVGTADESDPLNQQLTNLQESLSLAIDREVALTKRLDDPNPPTPSEREASFQELDRCRTNLKEFAVHLTFHSPHHRPPG